MTVAEAVAQSVFLAALADAGVSDLRHFRIPNRDSLLLLGAFALLAPSSGMENTAVLMHLAAGLAVFVAGALLFALGVWGGGDAKLLAAVAVWCGFAGLPGVLLVMALVGGGLAVAVLALRRLPTANPDGVKLLYQRLATSGHLPYGVAISAAAVFWWWGALRPGWPI